MDVEGYAPPAHPTVPGDGPQSPPAMARRDGRMRAESRAFLFDHGYEAGFHIRAYTSRTRDAARAKHGLPPLKGSEAEVAGADSDSGRASGRPADSSAAVLAAPIDLRGHPEISGACGQLESNIWTLGGDGFRADVLESVRASGPGYNTRVEHALRAAGFGAKASRRPRWLRSRGQSRSSATGEQHD